MESNRNEKNLEQLENEIWDEPNYPSHLVQRCHQLRKKPLKEFEIEDLRIMIGQNIGLKYLIPISVEKLNENLFLSGDFYEGDLLQAVLNVESNFWKENPTLKGKMQKLIFGREEELEINKIKFEKFKNKTSS